MTKTAKTQQPNKQVGRAASPLNIDTRPGVGMSFIIKDTSSHKYVRASTCCDRDLKKGILKVTQLRSWTATEPFFYVKVGSYATGNTLLKFLCGVNHKKCVDSTGAFEWTGISLQQARKDKMVFEEPNYVANKDEAAKVKTVKKISTPKSVKKSAKVKSTKTKKSSESLLQSAITEVKSAKVKTATHKKSAVKVKVAHSAPSTTPDHQEETPNASDTLQELLDKQPARVQQTEAQKQEDLEKFQKEIDTEFNNELEQVALKQEAANEAKSSNAASSQ